MTDATAGDRLAIACPACSPDQETVHEVLSPGSQLTVRCTDCEHVHKTAPPTEPTVQRRVVVSQGEESLTTTADVPREERLAVGEEFLLETGEAILTARITSLELDDGRVEAASAEEVETLWTRAVGNVAVNATIHPTDGRHDETRSETLQVPGDYEFVVGETDDLAGEEFTVEGIHLRDDARGYDHEKLDYQGDVALAKDVNRLYVRDESSTAWSAW
jgi:uncharacterized Zn finger protein